MTRYRIPVVAIIIICCSFSGAWNLSCYECSDTFKTIWRPENCQKNASLVAQRECNPQQQYCLVKSVSVKGIVTEIVRDCAEDCRYGCEATSFGITKMTCVSCCETNFCNTGSGGQRSAPLNTHLHHMFIVIAFQTLVWSLLSPT